MPQRRSWQMLEGQALEALALAGERDAWGELARRHTRRVVVGLLARGAELGLAEDLAQEAWLRLILNQQTGRLAALSLPGLAIAQAEWLLRERRRSMKRREAIAGTEVPLGELEVGEEPRSAAPDPERETADRESVDRVLSALRRCSCRSREVFQAVYGSGGRSQDEVAKELGLSLQRVRQILCEVRARLRSALRDGDEDGTWNT